MTFSILWQIKAKGLRLSSSFCEYQDAEGLAQPEPLILISPWIDVSMSGGYVELDPMLGRTKSLKWNSIVQDYEELDPMLGVDGLRETSEV